MKRNGCFKGRSISVVGDLSVDEQRYLYRKARELKAELAAGGDAARFRIADADYSAYLVFLENSTRTRESFRNAALFHRVRATMFDARALPTPSRCLSATRLNRALSSGQALRVYVAGCPTTLGRGRSALVT